MNKILKINDKIFYVLLIIILLFAFELYVFEFFDKTVSLTYFFGYAFLFFLLPLLLLSILIFLFSNFKKYGFIEGLKQSSIKIFILMIGALLTWGIVEYGFDKKNRINVKITNETEFGISNITLIGRNANTKIDSLAPNNFQTVIFKGKNINYKTENDYENEISLLYYYENKWREKKILRGFSRWRVIRKDWNIRIHSGDSIEIESE
ncbi:hypothetical protein [Cellulophaga sp. Hel_I_12]|uniref:hypothetical protein n=1 Tax=Cellulophaga sp. Hel_I_12 TaxID=1249972 RepID=UPI000646C75D|nr:hypothetical protein [Cellulophaga sp. Hel_I_12]